MTEAEYVTTLLKEGAERYKSQGKPEEYFLIDLVLDWMRLSAKERNSLKAKRKAKKEAKRAKSF